VVCALASPGWAAPRFGRPGVFPVDSGPIGVRAAAIDSQSGRDLVTANATGDEGPSLSLLLNRGAGSFFPEQRMSLGTDMSTPQGIATGDFNADGRDDLAVLVQDVSMLPSRAEVLVYLNTGNGFAQPVTYSLGPTVIPRCLETFDVTGDGALDLVGCHSTSTASGDAQGLLAVLAGGLSAGKPNGTFQSTSYPVGATPSGVDAGDIDGDGHADLLVVDGQHLWILYGTGGSFGSPTPLTGVGTPAAALIDVLPGQNLAQLLVEDDSKGKLFSIKQTAARVFAAPTDITPAGQLFAFPRKATATMAGVPTVMQLAKIDGDQINDLVVLSGLGADLWYGQADGTFAFGEDVTKDSSLDGLALADLNGDGKIDVAASDSTNSRVTVILNGADVPPTPTPVVSGTTTPSPTRTGVPGQTGTPTATGRVLCPGDCEGTRTVTIADLIKGVNIALGQAAVGTCPAFDLDNNGKVSINELVAAVNSVLDGCAS
jgi:hypothetical protein